MDFFDRLMFTLPFLLTFFMVTIAAGIDLGYSGTILGNLVHCLLWEVASLLVGAILMGNWPKLLRFCS